MASFLPIFTLCFFICTAHSILNPELTLLLTIKSSIDPQNKVLSSWTEDSEPCSGMFEGVACDENGQVANISLQGKGLSGQIPAAIGGLTRLTGLYLHFNELRGEIPKEIATLTMLSDLYLNVNNLSGTIPPQIGNMSDLQVLQLCYNKLSGSIPSQLGSLQKLSVLALQSNQLSGSIPASLGDFRMLTRLDLSSNRLIGTVPLRLAHAPMLEVLDVQNNNLSGFVPPVLRRLNDGFRYANNSGMCGSGFTAMETCTITTNKPEPTNLAKKNIPLSANVPSNCTNTSCSQSAKEKAPSFGVVIFGVVGVIVAVSIIPLFMFVSYRRRKQKNGSTLDSSDCRLSTDQVKEVCLRSASSLISLDYSNGWDPLARRQTENGWVSQESLDDFTLNLEDIEFATQHFSEVNVLGKSNFTAVYKGILRTGVVVAVKRISKSSCKADESEFLRGLKMLTLLRHENIVRLRGFCCSKGRGECFLVYDFVPNGNLLQYLDLKDGSTRVLPWSTRVSIIHGIAKGVKYLHGNKPVMVSRNLSADKVLLDQHFNPLLGDSGIHKLLAEDIIFSTMKSSAAMGYLAPEYITTGRFTEYSDVYAFGMMLFQIISGKRRVSLSTRQAAEASRYVDFIDANLKGKFSEDEASKLGKLALVCTHELPDHRPSMANVVRQLTELLNKP
ncbi:hypothetical protein QQ045_033588 [Rhodiola kirilowii]